MLLSAGLPVPRCVFGHGFLTSSGLKMGKSMGNVVDPKVAALTGLAFLNLQSTWMRPCKFLCGAGASDKWCMCTSGSCTLLASLHAPAATHRMHLCTSLRARACELRRTCAFGGRYRSAIV
jgi:hypothetical protein